MLTPEMCIKIGQAITNAIVLVKEQDAVKPVLPEDELGLYRCGKCYHQLFRCVDKYCSKCAQAVKWDD
jgi:peptide methionine sulfoxide reductase MsrB